MTAIRLLNTADVGDLMAVAAASADARPLLEAVARVASETCPYRLLTVLRYIEPEAVVERLYSSDANYPAGGRKPLSQYPTNHAAMATGEVFLAASRADVQSAFADHERLFAMGFTAILNAPIRHAGRRLGTLNLCGVEGQFGAGEIQAARILAGILVPALLGLAM